MHIMFVDDNPYEKVEHLISYLEQCSTEFTYVIINSSKSAARYILEHGSDIDLAVIDLGLPMFDNGSEYHALRGLDVIDVIYRKFPIIPIIINSTTDVSKEIIQCYVENGLIIKHCKPLRENTLLSFTKKGNVHLVEPYFDDTDTFVFWVDSEDDALVKKYFNQIEKNISELKLETPNLNATVTISSNNKIILICNDELIAFAIQQSGGTILFDGI